MRFSWLANIGVSVAALMLASGCILFQTGSASTDGEIGGRSVNVGGTVFAWWDVTVYDQDNDGNLFKQTRDGQHESLNIRLYGYAFNPREDFRFLGIDQQLELARNININDSLEFTVGSSGGIANGARLTYSTAEPPTPGDQPYLAGMPDLGLGWIKVNETNEYPSTVKELGSLRNFTLELKKVSRKSGEAIEGSFEVKIDKDSNDRGSIVTGSVKGDFTAVVLHERIAECNFDNGGAGMGVDPCDDLEYDGVNP